MLRTTFLLVSLTMLAGGAYAAQSALDIQSAAYAGPPATQKVAADKLRLVRR